MRKIQIVFICAACLFFVTSMVTAQKPKNSITNADVLEMVKAGLAESTVILTIQQSEPNFDTSPKALIELSKQGVSQKILDAMLQAQPTKAVPPIKAVDANAIATKDIGSLRVVLKSVLPLKLDYGRSGVRCTFEFINLETQKPIVVAMNARASFSRMNEYLRSTLVDENGALWYLKNSDVTGGVGKVAVGTKPYNDSFYDSAEIVTLLSKRDDLGSDFFADYRYHPFIFGSMTDLSPEQSVTVTAIFVQDGNQTTSDMPAKVFQMATEIVVGIVKSGTKKSYTLYNLTFDRVSLPAKGS